MKKTTKKSFILKKIIALMLTMLLMTSVLVSLIACVEEEPKAPYLGEIKMYDSSGNEIAHSEWVTVKYTGEEVVFTADYIINEHFEKKFDEIHIVILKRNPETFLEDRQDSGWQKDDLEWPKEIGEYTILMSYSQHGDGINVDFTLIVEE